ncbi:hypothetical protein AAFP35_12340 [Gordonia sp. CPCC 206044]|uniref:hypothetical protein n=1 Tax=Gordonia sp. CPCC 206044 TaxID=3140793 RepID=UPI003AF3EF57
MNRKKTTTIIASTGVLLAALLAAQTTGVLASWQTSVWANAPFGRAQVAHEGYARALGGQHTGDDGTYFPAFAERTHLNPGDSGVIPGEILREGGGYHGYAAASVQAKFDPYEGGSATAELDEFRIIYNDPANGMHLNAPIRASVNCPTDGTAPSVTPPTGTFDIQGTPLTIPAPNAKASAKGGNWWFHETLGELEHIQVVTETTASSTLIMHASGWVAGPRYWWSDHVLTQVSCSTTGGAPPAALTSGGPDGSASDSQPPIVDDAESDPDTVVPSEPDADGPEIADSSNGGHAIADESEDGDHSAPPDKVGAPLPIPGPTTPSDIRPHEEFAVIDRKGTLLGRATITDVRSRAAEVGDPATVAVRMSISTSDVSDDQRLSALASDSFRQVLPGDDTAPVDAADGTHGPAMPESLQPNQTYEGWVTFAVDHGRQIVMWLPNGTAGWRLNLPSAAVAAPPAVTSPPTDPVTPQPSAPPTPDMPAATMPAESSGKEDSSRTEGPP